MSSDSDPDSTAAIVSAVVFDATTSISVLVQNGKDGCFVVVVVIVITPLKRERSSFVIQYRHILRRKDKCSREIWWWKVGIECSIKSSER